MAGLKAFLVMGMLLSFSAEAANPYYRCREVSRALSKEKKPQKSYVKILSLGVAASLGLLGLSLWRADRLPFSFANEPTAIHARNYSEVNQFADSKKSASESSDSKENTNEPQDPSEILKKRFSKYEAYTDKFHDFKKKPDMKKIIDDLKMNGDEESLWTLGLTTTEKIESLSKLATLLQLLENSENLNNHKNDEYSGVKTSRSLFSYLAANLPYPEELSEEARSKYENYDKAIQDTLKSLSESQDPVARQILDETLSRLWIDQFRSSGTVSLPSYFQRSYIDETVGKKTYRFRRLTFNHPGEEKDFVIVDPNIRLKGSNFYMSKPIERWQLRGYLP